MILYLILWLTDANRANRRIANIIVQHVFNNSEVKFTSEKTKLLLQDTIMNINITKYLGYHALKF